MSTAVEKLKGSVAQVSDRPQPKSIAQLIKENEPRILRSLPATTNLTTERLSQLAMTTIRNSPTLGNCTGESLLGALMTAAQLGLEIGPLGHAYLVPFKRNKKVGPNEWQTTWECTFIIGYRGILELARRSGEILSIEARTVHANDEFDYAYGLSPKLHHKPALTDPGESVAYYGVAKFRDGGYYFLVMSLDDINRIRDKSPSYNPKDPKGVWHDEYDAMARKSVIRQMAPYLPLSTDMARAFNADEQVRTAIDVEELDVQRPPMPVELDVPSEPTPPLETEAPADGSEPFFDDPQVVDAGGASTREGEGSEDGAVPSDAAEVEPRVTSGFANPPALTPDWVALPDDVDSLAWVKSLAESDVRALAGGLELDEPPSMQTRHLQKIAAKLDQLRAAL